MAGNSIGKNLVLTTCGESHGTAMFGILDGCPAGLPLCVDDFLVDMQRRKTAQSRFTSQRVEEDQVELISGVFDGYTTGAPIGLLVKNTGQRSSDYEAIKDQFRPGHADYTYFHKYGRRDYRGGGRASARETVIRVAAGVIAKKYLAIKHGVKIQAYCQAIGPIKAGEWDLTFSETNPFYFPDKNQIDNLENLITQLRRDGDSIGALVQVIAKGVPCGWGEPIFSRLEADIAQAMLSIPASRAVGIGDGFDVVNQRGSEHRDEITPEGFLSNHSGGVLGGISTGQDLLVQIAFKPSSSILKPGRTVNEDNQAVMISTKGRHDPCVGIRAVPIVEAMLALVLMDHGLLNIK